RGRAPLPQPADHRTPQAHLAGKKHALSIPIQSGRVSAVHRRRWASENRPHRAAQQKDRLDPHLRWAALESITRPAPGRAGEVRERNMPLELDSLKKAVAALNGVLAKSDDAELMGGLDEITQNAIKSGVIQHFEFTYELCWKFIKRWLEVNISPTTGDGVARRELFRLAAENRLIVDVDEWMQHHE